MKKIQFRVTLLSDVILNQKSATEGSNSTLDFIPGNCFLGIVASILYPKVTPEESLDLFHNGTVRYGDAHIVTNGSKVRSLKVPVSFFYEKQHSASEACFVFHAYDRDMDKKKLQLKQCRHGFYMFENMEARPVEAVKSFVLKSAYDISKRRSKDGALFGYESMSEGQEFLFSVECDNEKYAEMVKAALVGIKRIGRSRNSQYGLCEIREDNFTESKSNSSHGLLTTVYADGRLIFSDVNGQPYYRPTPSQLGFDPKAKVRWDLSQIRTFQYAPWNGVRQSYDADRCGIEKGSVFVVETESPFTPNVHYIGNYQYEGFGAVIYNPDFLEAKDGTNGETKYSILPLRTKTDFAISTQENTLLLQCLERLATEDTQNGDVFDAVNKFTQNDAFMRKFRIGDSSFKSQWGNIRMIAMEKENPEDIIQAVDDYISKGIASRLWKAYNRRNILIDTLKHYACRGVDIRKLTINLASEMAKKTIKGNYHGEN